MKLSVVIVNYNVLHFLEQCLFSVFKAVKNIPCEVFVVDNDSVDGSVAMVREKFPQVKLIENKSNFGFSYANNQAIRISRGEYILLLNPDTVVEEDTFIKILNFMDSKPDAGGLGVKMIDGKGRYLPESKRGLPTPTVAFYKVFGISKIFPKSKKFGKYHLGYLNKDKIHEVEILAGAFMLLRKTVIDKTGLLDETFFMYGEDIDLSYRITCAGYRNYYFAETTIIHYKGESTKKGSINYVRIFYNAMIIFAKKHFSSKNAKAFTVLINIAIYIRAFLAILSNFIKDALLPILDAFFIFIGFYLIKPYWEIYKFGGSGEYPDTFLKYAVPAYIIFWISSIFLTGGYERPAKIINILKGILAGTILILVAYALLNEEYRFSRALIIFGSLWAFTVILIVRVIFKFLKIKEYVLSDNIRKKVAVIGYTEEAQRVGEILRQSGVKPNVLGFISPENIDDNNIYMGNIGQLPQIVRINKIDELIFCARDISTQNIIKSMLSLSEIKIDYKIASPDSISVIGSNSINTSGDLYTINLNLIAKSANKRNKRLLDFFLALIFLGLSPLLVFLQKNPLNFHMNIIYVFLGMKSWVGYDTNFDKVNINLPKIKKGVLCLSDVSKKNELKKEVSDRINIAYARDYKLLNDLVIVVKGIRMLGKK